MSQTIGEAYIQIRPDTRTFEHSLKKTVKSAAFIAGGVFSVAAAKSFIDAGQKSILVTKQTIAVLKSTKGAANISAKAISDLATSISNKTGIDDEAIQSGENLLLTFTNVQNKVGKGNDIFNQATMAIEDMSVALGQDTKSSAIQLGKALNDPIKGTIALRKVGVSFTSQQQDQIKALVKSGKTLEAQKVILKELGKEFGGSAVAAATPMKKLGVQLDNIKESIGQALLPLVNKLAEWLSRHLPGAIKAVGRAFAYLKDHFIEPLKFAFTSGDWFAVGPVEKFAVIVGKAARALVGAMKNLSVAMKPVAMFIQRNLRPILIGLGAAIASVLIPAFAGWAVAAASAAAATLAAAAPAIAIGVALAGLAAGVTLAYEKFKGFRDVVDTVAQFLQKTFASVLAYTKSVWPQVSEAIGHVMNAIRDVVSVGVAFVQLVWRNFGGYIVGYLKGVWEAIYGIISGGLEIIKGIIQVVLAVINGDWSKAWEGLKTIVKGAVRIITGVVSGLWDSMASVFSAGFKLLKKAWTTFWHEIWSIASGIVDQIVGWINEAINRAKDLISALLRALGLISKERKTTDPGQPGSPLNPKQPIVGGDKNSLASFTPGHTYNLTVNAPVANASTLYNGLKSIEYLSA